MTSAEQAMVEGARAFARDRIAPHAESWETRRVMPAETLRAAGEAGLTGFLVPEALGGRGASITAVAKAAEHLAGGCMAFALSLLVHNNVAATIARMGSERHRDALLPAMLRGEKIGAFCLTEPAAGSDAAAISTRAEKSGEDWKLTGEKAWVTNAGAADVFLVFAQTDPERRWRGIAGFLVEGDSPGIEKGPPYALAGGHAAGVGGLSFGGCRVPAENLVLAPGEGFKTAMAGITIARIFVGAMCSGIMQVCLDLAVDYGAKRRAFGRPIAAFQGLRWLLADVATDLAAARLLTYRAAATLDAGRDAVLPAAHAKKFATRAALKGIAECMQAMGAAGLRAEYPFGRHLASAKIAQFLDGTTEIQNVVIARALFRDRDIAAD